MVFPRQTSRGTGICEPEAGMKAGRGAETALWSPQGGSPAASLGWAQAGAPWIPDPEINVDRIRARTEQRQRGSSFSFLLSSFYSQFQTKEGYFHCFVFCD